MIDKGIKNLLIDFGGVLIDLNRQRCLEQFKTLGFTDIEQMLGECHQKGFFLQQEKGLISSADFRATICERMGRQVPGEDIDAAWNSFLVGIPDYKLELLLELRKHYNLLLLSNTNEIHWRWSCERAFAYKGYRVEDFFDRIYLSYEMHLAKPDLQIFQEVVEEAEILPAETFFIDDSAENCRTAEMLGITTYTPLAGEDWSHLFKI